MKYVPKDHVNLFHISQKNLNGQILTPRVPNNEFVRWGIEDGVTPRVSFASSVGKCLTGLGRGAVGQEFYVFVPDTDVSDHVVYPTKSQVPDVEITREVWVTVPVKLKYKMKIKVTGQGKTHRFVAKRKDNGQDYVGTPCDWNYEIVRTPVEVIKDIFKNIKYGLRDPSTNRPWKDTHKDTRWQDYDSEWRLATPEQTIAAGIGNCYDTVAISREYLKKTKGIQFRTFFMVNKDGEFMEDPTHTFLIYWDTDDYWKWLEGSWGPFKNNDWQSKNPKDLIKWIATAMANMEGKDIVVYELSSYPRYGCDMTEFERFCRQENKVGVFQSERK